MRQLIVFILLFFIASPVLAQSDFVFELVDPTEENLEAPALEIAKNLGNSELIPGINRSWVAKFKNFTR